MAGSRIYRRITTRGTNWKNIYSGQINLFLRGQRDRVFILEFYKSKLTKKICLVKEKEFLHELGVESKKCKIQIEMAKMLFFLAVATFFNLFGQKTFAWIWQHWPGAFISVPPICLSV